jgi:hypothetical protein
MTGANGQLIAHVQALVQPRDLLPPNGPAEVAGALRSGPPDWVMQADLNDPVWGSDDQVAVPDGDVWDGSTCPALDPDAHAFYLPFHFYRSRWGIYIRATSIPLLTAYLLNTPRLRGDALERAVARGVLQMLLAHETFHHFTELAVSRLEAVALEFMHGDSLYARAFVRQSAYEVEEGMANAFSLCHVAESMASAGATMRNVVLAHIASFMERQPPGYRDFDRYTHDTDFKRGQDMLIGEAKMCANALAAAAGNDGLIRGAAHFVERARSTLCPVRVVFEPGISVGQLRPFPKHLGMQAFVHTRGEHPPPHFHLDKPPGVPYGRFLWPSLQEYPGERPLAGKEAAALRAYVLRYQPEFYNRIRAVFPDVGDLP